MTEKIKKWIAGAAFFAGGFGVALDFFNVGRGVFLFVTSLIVFGFLLFLGGFKNCQRDGVVAEKDAERKLTALMQSVQEGVVVYDYQFRVVGFNPVAEEIFNLEAASVIGKVIEPRLAENKKFRKLVQIIFPSLASSVVQISGANKWPQKIRIITEDPSARLFTALDRVFGADGRVLYFFKSVRDETREQEILESKTEFINTAAHQLRTPLTAVNWALENIRSLAETTSPEIAETAEEALRTSERALKITNDLLDVAKIEEGRFGYELKEEKLFSFIDEVVGALEPIAKQYGISLSFSRANFQDVTIHIDKSRLGLALYNLIDNAIKYNLKNGSVEVWVEKIEKDFVRINVRDSGAGIPPEEQQKIFKKFYRASNAAELQPNGNGLGLFITRNIIKRHGGDIGFESQLNRGTTFWFTLPLSSSLVPEKESVFEDSYI